MQKQVDLVKDKQGISADFTKKHEQLQKEVRHSDSQQESFLKLINQIQQQKYMLRDMRNQIYEMDD